MTSSPPQAEGIRLVKKAANWLKMGIYPDITLLFYGDISLVYLTLFVWRLQML